MSFGYYKRLTISKVIEIKMITLWHHHTDAWHTFRAQNPIILSFPWIKRNENTKSHIVIAAKHKTVYEIISNVLVRRTARIIRQFSWYIQSHSDRERESIIRKHIIFIEIRAKAFSNSNLISVIGYSKMNVNSRSRSQHQIKLHSSDGCTTFCNWIDNFCAADQTHTRKMLNTTQEVS